MTVLRIVAASAFAAAWLTPALAQTPSPPPAAPPAGGQFIACATGRRARKMIYVKDEDGLFTADPKKDAKAKHIPRISVQELLAENQDDLVVERAVLDLMLSARHIREIQFVNGLKPRQLSAALNGEPVGTLIHS